MARENLLAIKKRAPGGLHYSEKIVGELFRVCIFLHGD
jgi:hypothetical protein